jgi:penicillin-binding protein activator
MKKKIDFYCARVSRMVILVLSIFIVSKAALASSVENVDINNDKEGAVMGLDYRDFQDTAAYTVSSLLQSGAVDKKDGGRYVLAISSIINDTMQRIDTDQLIKKIRIELLKSGKVVVTTAVGAFGPEDALAMQARELRMSKEFNQNTVAKSGQMVAPELSLSGKILQRNLQGSNGKQQVEYTFMLTLTDINTGLAVWEDEKPIIKRGNNKSVSW